MVINPVTRHPYNDNLCFFRCLAVYRKMSDTEGAVEIYREMWQRFKSSFELYEGIVLEEIPDLEVCFDVNIAIFHLDDHDHATTLYASTSTFKEDLLFNAWQNHLMLLTEKSRFCSKYVCSTVYKRLIELTI